MYKKYFIIVIGSLAAIVLPFKVFAATISVVPRSTGAMVGQPFTVDVLLDTDKDVANTVQATISYPANLFSLTSINNGASIVNLWIESPKKSSTNMVDLAGIIPGGWSGSRGNIVTLEFQPIVPGTGSIVVPHATVLRNDGQGSSIDVTQVNAQVSIAAATPNAPLPTDQHSSITPNPFTPVISQDPSIYNGSYFLVFSASDKGTGIDHYEVLENSTWHMATSPYLLEDQSLSSNIFVRAVDHAGNFIVVEVPARYPQRLPLGFIIFIACLAALVVGSVLVFLLWLFKKRGRRV